MDTSVAFAPLIPWLALYILGGAAILACAAGLFLRARGVIVRLLALGVLWLILANPSLIVENREPQRDTVVIVVDQSRSQDLGERKQRTEKALAELREKLAKIGNLDIRVVRGGATAAEDGTFLFAALDRALADLPRKRLAGVVMITDGQVHDVPPEARMIRGIAPFHVLLSGRKDEQDRKLVVENAPAFGLMGKPLQMKLRVDDGNGATGGTARLTIKRDGTPWKTLRVPVGRSVTLDFELEHPGTTYFEVEVEPGQRELTLENNRKVVAVNGIRDRLRVLLISGEPHPGERAWRNLLKADPGVDLVHFTILRPPEKRDLTPVNELALISFPVRELFQEKLDQFHLIIFDRYKRRGVIRSRYLQNIADYVKKGGALLVAAGPAYAGNLSLGTTAIGPLLPSEATGQIFEEGFRAKRSDLGKRHPVTGPLTGSGVGPRPWGRWFRHIDARAAKGQVLLNGARGRPLLVLDRVEKGRVAQLLTDQAWLWDRGFDNGGPQAELLRRLSHWLMKEPELEENALRARIVNKRLEVTRRRLTPDNRTVTVTGPDGVKRTLPMKNTGDGLTGGSMPITKPGLYRITDGELSTMAAIGSLNAREMADARATEDKLKPVVDANSGSFTWLAETGTPEIRRISDLRRVAGTSGLVGGRWIGLKETQDYIVTGIREVPLFLGLIALLIALLPMLLAWRREGK